MEQVVGETEEIWKLYVNVMLFPAFSALPAEAISTITGNVPRGPSPTSQTIWVAVAEVVVQDLSPMVTLLLP